MTRFTFLAPAASIDGGDDLTLVFFCKHRWPLKNGGVGGGARPPHLQTKSAQPSPRANMNDPHGDDQMLVFCASIDGGDDLMLRTEFAYCKHKRSTWRRADACSLVQASTTFKSGGVGGRRSPPHLQTKSAQPSPINLGGTKHPRPRRDKTMTDSRVLARSACTQNSFERW